MNFHRTILMVIIAVAICAFIVLRDIKQSTPTLIYYEGGRAETIPDNHPEFAKIVDTMETLLRTADDALLLALDDDFIAIKRTEKALELLYPIKMTVQVSGNGVRSPFNVELDRMLIPLSGPIGGANSVIFYGSGHYEAGPIVNKRSRSDLESLVPLIIKK